MAVALAAGPLWPLVVYGEIVEGHPVRTGVPWGGYRPWVGVFSIGAKIAAYGEVPIQADLQLKPQLSVLEERQHTELLTAAPHLSTQSYTRLCGSRQRLALQKDNMKLHILGREVMKFTHRSIVLEKNMWPTSTQLVLSFLKETTMGHVKNIFIILRTN